MLDVIKDDFELSPRAKHDKCEAAVSVAQETAYLTPTYLANSLSNLFIFGLWVMKLDFTLWVVNSLKSTHIFYFLQRTLINFLQIYFYFIFNNISSATSLI